MVSYYENLESIAEKEGIKDEADALGYLCVVMAETFGNTIDYYLDSSASRIPIYIKMLDRRKKMLERGLNNG